MKNNEIAGIFERTALFLEIKDDNVFKIRAYQKAADNIRNVSEDIETLVKEDRLSEIPGVGTALKEKITEYVSTGKMSAYEKLIKEIPEGLLDVVAIPSVGPKKAKLFYKELNVRNIGDLEKAIDRKKLIGLPGIKDKTIANIARGIRLVKAGQERMDLAMATAVSEEFVDALKQLREVKQISVAGSLRRKRETVRDIDILVDSSNPKKVMDYFVGLPQVARVVAHGDTKSSVLTHDSVQVDLRVVEPKSFGAALFYFTGSKSFNIKVRQIAIKKKMKVSEYGLFSVKGKKEAYIAGRTEQDMCKKLGLAYLPPELREDIGGPEIFTLKKAPPLIEINDIKGDLHVHSVWSDGHDTIEELASAAQARGYEYVAICDHSPRLKVVKTVSEKELITKRKEIDRLNKKFKNFRILTGTEVEIDANGNLDYNDKTLSTFDFVIAAIHSGFEQKPRQLTSRIIKACKNKYVNAIAHPRGTHLGKREPYEVDFNEVCKVAVDTNTFLEINAFPFRLDLNSTDSHFAKKHNVKFVINTDSHSVSHLGLMQFGVAIARRGWLGKQDVINALPIEKLLSAINKTG